MNKKIISGLMIAFAIVIPSSSAFAASNQIVALDSQRFRIMDATGLSAGDSIEIDANGVIYSSTISSIISEEGINQVFVNTPIPDELFNGDWFVFNHTPSSTTGANYSPMSMFDTVKGWITSRFLPAIAGLVILGISVRLAISAVRKFSKVA